MDSFGNAIHTAIQKLRTYRHRIQLKQLKKSYPTPAQVVEIDILLQC